MTTSDHTELRHQARTQQGENRVKRFRKETLTDDERRLLRGHTLVHGFHRSFQSSANRGDEGRYAFGAPETGEIDASGKLKGATPPKLAYTAADLIGPTPSGATVTIVEPACGTGTLGAAAIVELATRPPEARPLQIEYRGIDANPYWIQTMLEGFDSLAEWGAEAGVKIVADGVVGDIFDITTWTAGPSKGRLPFATIAELSADADILLAAPPALRIIRRENIVDSLKAAGIERVGTTMSAMIELIYSGHGSAIETIAVTRSDWMHHYRERDFRSRLRRAGSITDVEIALDRYIAGSRIAGSAERGSDTIVWRFAPGAQDAPCRIRTWETNGLARGNAIATERTCSQADVYDSEPNSGKHRVRTCSTGLDHTMARIIDKGAFIEVGQDGMRVHDGILSVNTQRRSSTGAESKDTRFTTGTDAPAALIESVHVRTTRNEPGGYPAVKWPVDAPERYNGYHATRDEHPTTTLEPGWYVAMTGPQIHEPGTGPVAAIVKPDSTAGKPFAPTKQVLIIGEIPTDPDTPGVATMSPGKAIFLCRWINSTVMQWYFRVICRRTNPKGIDVHEMPLPIRCTRHLFGTHGDPVTAWRRAADRTTAGVLMAVSRIEHARQLVSPRGRGDRDAAAPIGAAFAAAAALSVPAEGGRLDAERILHATNQLLRTRLHDSTAGWIRTVALPDLVLGKSATIENGEYHMNAEAVARLTPDI